jgi:hypothetical protein
MCQQQSKKRDMFDQYTKTLTLCEIILLLSLQFILAMQLVIFSCKFFTQGIHKSFIFTRVYGDPLHNLKFSWKYLYRLRLSLCMISRLPSNFHMISNERSYHLTFRYIQLCLIGTHDFVFLVFHMICFTYNRTVS